MNTIENNKNCVVYITHILNVDIVKYLLYLKEEIHGIMDFIVLYDCAKDEMITDNYSYFEFYKFDSKKLEGFFFQKDRLLANPLIALIDWITYILPAILKVVRRSIGL